MSGTNQNSFLKFRCLEAEENLKKILAFLSLFLITFGHTAWAEDATTAEPTKKILGMEGDIATIVIVFGIVILFAAWLVFFGSKTISKLATKVSAERGLPYEETVNKYHFKPSIFPEQEMRGNRKIINTKKGFDIAIIGQATLKTSNVGHASTFAIKPIDFHGLSPIPKMQVAEGDSVKAGDVLFYDKTRPEVKFTSPVSGTVVKIERGEKRSIMQVVVQADNKKQFKEFGTAKPESLSRDQIVNRMLESGAWQLIKQRPYSIIPDPADSPKMVYISTFDSSPLAPDYNFTLKNEKVNFQAGVNALGKLSGYKVHIGLNAAERPSDVFLQAEGVTKHWFKGPHPVGNVGVQIHHVNPINKGEVVWVVNPQDVVIIGRLFTEGRFNTEKTVALAGPEVKNPQYYKTFIGGCIEEMVKDNLIQDHVRYISGNVLTGKKIEANGYLGYSDNLVSVIQEGDEYEFLGWLLPSYPRPSLSPSFLSFIFQGEELRVNTNMHGEHRAFVSTGVYEQVLPMDIYPMLLFKAIMAEDFEKMEGLGIYEIDEEDVALCEFVCPSKSNLQEVVRAGLNLMHEQG